MEPFDSRTDRCATMPTAPSRLAEAGEMVLVSKLRVAQCHTWTGRQESIEVLGRRQRAGRRHRKSSLGSSVFPTRTPKRPTRRHTDRHRRQGNDIKGRTDFRQMITVTIDGEHARDFDDAIRSSGCRTATTGSACTSRTSPIM